MQIVGKVKLELIPFLNDWWNVTFAVAARGLTTLTIPFGQRVFQVDFDVIDHQVKIDVSDGSSVSMPLAARSVADFFRKFMTHLESLGIQVTINTRPVEVDDGILFEDEHVHAAYDPIFVNRWWHILFGATRVVERYRTPLRGQEQPRPVLVGFVRPGDHPLLRATGAASGVARTLYVGRCQTGASAGRVLARQ